MDDLVVEHVLRAVEAVPAGCVVSYGDIAALVGLGPRQVGRVLSQWGGELPWWRVTNASGELPAHLRDEAAHRWSLEGIQQKPNGRGCRIAHHRPDPDAWAEAYRSRASDLPALTAT